MQNLAMKPEMFDGENHNARHLQKAVAISADEITVDAGEFQFAAQMVRFTKGAQTAIVGPNGSGKSTLLETLLGFRKASIVNALILDVPAQSFMHDVKQLARIGTQLQRVEYADSARVAELLDLHRALYRHQDAFIKEQLGLDELESKLYRTLSKGQRQRLDLFFALAHKPELILLDEPFTGLDKTYTHRVIDLLKNQFAGATVIMICHSAEELSSVDELVWVYRGAIRHQGNKQVLRDCLAGQYRAFIQFENAEQETRTRTILTNEACVLRVESPEAMKLAVFGHEGLDVVIKSLMDSAHIRHFEFAPIDDGDLLRICTGEDAHV